jgi:branched-chain amino acid transport system permease protein
MTRSVRLSRISPVLIILGIAITLAIAGEVRPSIYATSVTIGFFSLLALPLGLLYGQGGAISLAQGGFAAVGAFTTAILTVKFGWSPFASLVVSVGLPAILAFVIARPLLRLPELSLALVTISLVMIFKVVFERAERLTGGYNGITGIAPLPIIGVERSYAHWTVWTAVLIVAYCYASYVESGRGRALNAIRVDRLLAESTGTNVALELSSLFSLSAGIAGLAGWFYAHYIGFMAPDSLDPTLSANILFMVVLGGRKSVLGPIVGASLFTLASDLLPGTVTQGMIFGSLLIVILVFFPDGIVSPGMMRWTRRRATTIPEAKNTPGVRLERA